MIDFIQLKPYWGDLAAAGAALTWAFAIIFFQKAGSHMRSIPLNIFKNNLAFSMILATALIRQTPLWPSLNWEQWGLIIASAVLGISISDVLMIESLKRLGAGMQAVVDCAYTPAILISAFVMFGEVLPPKDLAGGMVVLLAVWVGTTDPQLKKIGPSIWVGVFYGVFSHVAVGFAILMLKNIFPLVSLVWLVGARLLIGNLILVSFCICTGRWSDISQSFSPKGARLYLTAGTFLGSYVSVLLWALGFKYTLAGRAAIYNQLSTIFIILLAWLFLKEKMNRQRVIAIFLGLLGAWIVSQ